MKFNFNYSLQMNPLFRSKYEITSEYSNNKICRPFMNIDLVGSLK